VAALEAAAEKALHHGTWRLRDLRLLLQRAGPSPQMDFLETHPLIRSLDAFEALTPDCFTGSKTTPPLLERRTKTKRPNPSPTNL
jgi:hypothetical protein